MIDIKCDMCSEDLIEEGGLLFGPPNFESVSLKEHLCHTCYGRVRKSSVPGTTNTCGNSVTLESHFQQASPMGPRDVFTSQPWTTPSCA